MRRFSSMVRLSKPDWNQITVIAVWVVFFLAFLGQPILRNWRDPESPMHDPMPSNERFLAVIDSALTIQKHAQQLDLEYNANLYAEDLFWLRRRQQEVRVWLSAPGGSDIINTIVNDLYERARKSEHEAVIRRCRAANQSSEMCERMAQIEGFRTVNEAVGECQRRDPSLKPLGSKEMWSFARHFALSNLWAVLATALMLLIKLALLRRLKEELLLSPGRYFWSCIWWGYGISNYPGNDVASEIRFASLRQKHLRNLDRWHLTAQEEAALWLMARDRLVKFDEAIESVRELGTYALARPRRTLLTTVLIWLSSGSLNLRNAAAEATVVVEACQLAQVPVPELQLPITPFTPMGGGDKLSSDANAFAPSLISPVMMRLVCLGTVSRVVDQRKLFRTIRVKDCRAPPVISQEAHDEQAFHRHHAGHGAHGHFGNG